MSPKRKTKNDDTSLQKAQKKKILKSKTLTRTHHIPLATPEKELKKSASEKKLANKGRKSNKTNSQDKVPLTKPKPASKATISVPIKDVKVGKSVTSKKYTSPAQSKIPKRRPKIVGRPPINIIRPIPQDSELNEFDNYTDITTKEANIIPDQKKETETYLYDDIYEHTLKNSDHSYSAKLDEVSNPFIYFVNNDVDTVNQVYTQSQEATASYVSVENLHVGTEKRKHSYSSHQSGRLYEAGDSVHQFHEEKRLKLSEELSECETFGLSSSHVDTDPRQDTDGQQSSFTTGSDHHFKELPDDLHVLDKKDCSGNSLDSSERSTYQKALNWCVLL